MNRQLTDDEVKKWQQGVHERAYRFLGAKAGVSGTEFAVWAPNAEMVSVVGEFNHWDGERHPMEKDPSTGVWRIHIEGVRSGMLFKYHIKVPGKEAPLMKADPYGYAMEKPPLTASVVYDLQGFSWDDEIWMESRAQKQAEDQPIAIYEVHLQSWRRKKDGGYLSYRELAAELIPYVKACGFTHIEVLPITEHPHDPSWGYQVTGYFAPTRRLGDPKDFMYFVNECHKQDIGIIMDWVPAHFPKDEHGLHEFDGTALYGYKDPMRREQKDWGTIVFDYDKAGVRNFLLSNAHYWCNMFHIDGLRVDAVASMLYLDYSKDPGEWKPNKDGGNAHYEAIRFLQDFNEMIHREFPGVLTFAEESTAWEGVTHPVTEGGLGFDYKWNMGWMNDTLQYIQMASDERKRHPQKITFPMAYNESERYLLPLSHDEVVHLKKPLLKKSQGKASRLFANMRLLLTYMFMYPGKKLLFMGGEYAETHEWNERASLNWKLLQNPNHQGVKKMVQDLNQLYTTESALHGLGHLQEDFVWVTHDEVPGVFGFKRQMETNSYLLIFFNFSASYQEYQWFFAEHYKCQLIFNSNSTYYGGDNTGDASIRAGKLDVYLSPFSALVFKAELKEGVKKNN